jgi:hypothetical protein
MRTSLFLLLLGGCAATAPMTKTADEMDRYTHGSWVEVVTRTRTISGELIAAEITELVVLPPGDHTVTHIGAAQIESAKLIAYKSSLGGLAGIGILTVLGTISNGYILVITCPVSLIVTAASVGTEDVSPIYDLAKDGIETFRKFARFPQGMPPHVGDDLRVTAPEPPTGTEPSE